MLNEKLKRLFDHFELIIQDWKNEDHSFTNHYIETRVEYIFRKLHFKKNEIFKM